MAIARSPKWAEDEKEDPSSISFKDWYGMYPNNISQLSVSMTRFLAQVLWLKTKMVGCVALSLWQGWCCENERQRKLPYFQLVSRTKDQETRVLQSFLRAQSPMISLLPHHPEHRAFAQDLSGMLSVQQQVFHFRPVSKDWPMVALVLMNPASIIKTHHFGICEYAYIAGFSRP